MNNKITPVLRKVAKKVHSTVLVIQHYQQIENIILSIVSYIDSNSWIYIKVTINVFLYLLFFNTTLSSQIVRIFRLYLINLSIHFILFTKLCYRLSKHPKILISNQKYLAWYFLYSVTTMFSIINSFFIYFLTLSNFIQSSFLH